MNKPFDLAVEIEAARSRLGDLLANAILETNTSPYELAPLLGVDVHWIYQVLRGEQSITLPAVVEALFHMGKCLEINIRDR